MAKYHQRFNFDRFIKTVDKSLLAQYLTSQKVTLPSNTNINDPDQVRTIISNCPEEKRKHINEELFRINDLSVKQIERVMSIIKEKKIHYVEGEKPATSAMRVYFCDDPDTFDELYDLYLYDFFSERMYYYKFDGEGIKFSEGSLNGNLEKFREEIANHFEGCGKGDDCIVRSGKDGDNHFVIVLRSDAMKTDFEFLKKKTKTEKSRMQALTYRQAKQEILVFNPTTKVISVTSGIRSRGDKQKYVEAFGTRILGLAEVPEITFKKALVCTNPLKDPEFFKPTGDIERITLLNAYLFRPGNIDTKLNVKSLDVMTSFDQMKMKLEYYTILSASMKFKIRNIKKEIPVDITPPEVSAIKHVEGEEIIKKYLKQKKVLLV